MLVGGVFGTPFGRWPVLISVAVPFPKELPLPGEYGDVVDEPKGGNDEESASDAVEDIDEAHLRKAVCFTEFDNTRQLFHSVCTARVSPLRNWKRTHTKRSVAIKLSGSSRNLYFRACGHTNQ
jgi:hypothetical protein